MNNWFFETLFFKNYIETKKTKVKKEKKSYSNK